MTSQTNRDARERLAAAACDGWSNGNLQFGELADHHKHSWLMAADAILALLSPDEVEGIGSRRAEIAGAIACDPAYLAEVRDEQQTWLALHLADNIVSLLAEQPQPSVATGQPEQGALLSGWRDIETAPKDGSVFLAWPGEMEACNAAVPTSWYVHPSVQGWVTDAYDCGEYEFNPTHWMPLPAPPSLPADGTGRAPSPPQTAEAVPGTSKNPPPKGGE